MLLSNVHRDVMTVAQRGLKAWLVLSLSIKDVYPGVGRGERGGRAVFQCPAEPRMCFPLSHPRPSPALWAVCHSPCPPCWMGSPSDLIPQPVLTTPRLSFPSFTSNSALGVREEDLEQTSMPAERTTNMLLFAWLSPSLWLLIETQKQLWPCFFFFSCCLLIITVFMMLPREPDGL